MHTALRTLYFPERPYLPAEADPLAKKAAVERLTARTAAGNARQRVVALALLSLLDAVPDGAIGALEEDPQVSPAIRAMALQIRLVSDDGYKARQAAVEALRSERPQHRLVALRYLALGGGS